MDSSNFDTLLYSFFSFKKACNRILIAFSSSNEGFSSKITNSIFLEASTLKSFLLDSIYFLISDFLYVIKLSAIDEYGI